MNRAKIALFFIISIFALTLRAQKITVTVAVNDGNGADKTKPLHIELNGLTKLPGSATKTVLTGANADVVNPDGSVPAAKPEVSPIEVGREFDYEAPPNSLTVIRMKSK